MADPVLAFDIETVPDVEAGKTLYGLEGLSDDDVMRAMRQLRRQRVGHDFMPPHLQRIVAIGLVLEHEGTVRAWSLGKSDADEAELITRFFEGLEQYRPTLVSWNGGGFDLPVLAYRALRHGLSAGAYWEMGDNERDYRYNNYVSRYHWRHVDLMDVMAHFQPRANAPLDEVARLIGLPGKSGVGGAHVAEAWLAGDIEAIRDYCEIDTMNTYLIWLRFERLRGRLAGKAYAERLKTLREQMLTWSDRPHFVEFAKEWQPQTGA
ncbi:MAG: 3'-5' exonuclease [Gammaproteobacteria bacterium]